MKTPLAFVTLLLSFACSSPVWADSYYDYAKVLKVRPVYEYVSVREPVRECYTRRTRHHHAGGTILGAVVGGALGGAITDSRAGAFAGAVIGGAIGHDNDHRRGYRHRRTQVCEVQYEHIREVKELTGYRVKYRYRGKTYRTTMRNHPGDTIKVRVKVDPAY